MFVPMNPEVSFGRTEINNDSRTHEKHTGSRDQCIHFKESKWERLANRHCAGQFSLGEEPICLCRQDYFSLLILLTPR